MSTTKEPHEAKQMQEKGITTLVVLEKGNLAGLLTLENIMELMSFQQASRHSVK